MHMLMTAYAKSLIVNWDGTVLAGGERSSVFHNNGMSAYANCWNDLESNGTACHVSPFGHTWHQPLSTRILKPLVDAEGRHSALIPKIFGWKQAAQALERTFPTMGGCARQPPHKEKLLS